MFKIILNPAAGKGHGARVEAEMRRLLAEAGVEFDLVRTAGRWHAAELAEQAVKDGIEVVVAAGGDGTTHEVVNGLLAAADGDVAGTLGILPVGSGSDFAHVLGIPFDLPAACQLLRHGRPRLVDVGRVTVDDREARYFDNTINVGFGGIVTVEAAKIKWLRGMALYLPAVLKAIFLRHDAPLTTIRYDEQEMTLRTMMVTVGNGKREGGVFYVTPQASLDDGLFDLCIAGEVSRLAMLGLIPRFLKGTHTELSDVVTMARAGRVTMSSSDNFIAHADGEVLCTEAHRIEFELLPQRLRVLA